MKDIPLASQGQRHPGRQCLEVARQNETPGPGLLCSIGLMGLLLFGYAALAFRFNGVLNTANTDGKNAATAMAFITTALALLSLIIAVGNGAAAVVNYRRRRRQAKAQTQA